ncbi:uncharacterized protein WCC33_018630 [Rhinophrynus dorsalis]
MGTELAAPLLQSYDLPVELTFLLFSTDDPNSKGGWAKCLSGIMGCQSFIVACDVHWDIQYHLSESHSTLYTDDCLEEEDDEEDEHFELRNNADLEQYLKTFKILTEEDASFVLNVIQTITQALLRYKDDCMAKKATEETAESGDSSTSTVVSNPSRKRPFSPSSETDFAKKAKSECCNSSQTPLQDQQASNPSFTEDSSHRLQSDAGLTSPGSPASSETPSYVHTIITQLFGNRYNLGLTEVILELTNNDALKDPSIDAEAIIRTLVQTGRLNILLT